MGEMQHLGDFLPIRGRSDRKSRSQGAGIRILTRTISSPTLADQMNSLLKTYPQAKWHVYEPVNRDNVLAAAQAAFGQPVETQYKLEGADVVVSLDADFCTRVSLGVCAMPAISRSGAIRTLAK
jgi:hypothetical protein